MISSILDRPIQWDRNVTNRLVVIPRDELILLMLGTFAFRCCGFSAYHLGEQVIHGVILFGAGSENCQPFPAFIAMSTFVTCFMRYFGELTCGQECDIIKI